MAEAKQDLRGPTEATEASRAPSRAELSAAELSSAELRVAAQKLSQILTATDAAALDRLRKRRLARDDLAVDDLVALQGVLMELARLVEGGSVEAWARLAEAREALADGEDPHEDLDDAESAAEGSEDDPAPREPERLDRPAAGPPPAPSRPEPPEPAPLELEPAAVDRPRRDNVPSLQMSADEALRLARRASRTIEAPPFYGSIEPSSEDTPLRPARRAAPASYPSAADAPPPGEASIPEEAAPAPAAEQDLVQSPGPLPPPRRPAPPVEPDRGATARTRPILRDDETIAVMGLPPREVLPFVSARRDDPAESDAATRFFGFSSLAHPLALTVEEYAGLCAERDFRPHGRRQTEERYGIHDAPTREAVDRLFRRLFAADRDAYAAWEARYERFSRALSR